MNRYVKKPTCIIHKYAVQNNCPIVQLGPPLPNSRQYTLVYFDFNICTHP